MALSGACFGLDSLGDLLVEAGSDSDDGIGAMVTMSASDGATGTTSRSRRRRKSHNNTSLASSLLSATLLLLLALVMPAASTLVSAQADPQPPGPPDAIDDTPLPPVAIDDSYTTDADTTLERENVLRNDSDPNGDPLTVTKVVTTEGNPTEIGGEATSITLSSGAVVSMQADGIFSYNPDGQFDYLSVGEEDTDSFTYTASDSSGATDEADVTITINGVNSRPPTIMDPEESAPPTRSPVEDPEESAPPTSAPTKPTKSSKAPKGSKAPKKPKNAY